MRFVDLALDLAAVLNASRSVASKHIALRRRQLDAYSKSLSIAETWRTARPSRGAESGVRGAETGVGPEAAAAAAAGVDGLGRGAPLPETRAQSSARSDHEAERAGPSSPSSPVRPTAVRKEDVERDLHIPPDVDVGVFHTARGSRLLESSKDKGKDKRPENDGGAASSQPKQHPLRYWPDGPPAEADVAPGPLAHAVAQSSAAAPRAGLAPADAETGAREEPPATTTQAEAVGAAEVADGAEAYKLRESTVPASRVSRLWNYGGLAAGMLGGAMTEGISRALGGGSGPGSGSVVLGGNNVERLVARLSRMRGAALKLGQMLSLQDAKTLPAPMHEVLRRVQDRADYMPAWQRDRVLVDNLGADWRGLFDDFDETPAAAASIGQVHRAVLASSGRRVAVKIQFPGVAASIDSDLDNLAMLLRATRLLPKGLYLDKAIGNARVELAWECDYEREARCARRYAGLLRGEAALAVPAVHAEASSKQVLTMDWMEGIGVVRARGLTQEQRDWVGAQVVRLCLREMTEFGFMQTDPNWTNFLYNAARRRLELLDFGASRDFPGGFVRRYVRLLDAAARGDAAGVRALSRALGYLTGHESRAMVEAHVASVLTLAEPFAAAAPPVYDFRGQTITDRVRALIPLMLRERLAPPPEETYSLHRKLSGAFLLCARLGSRVPCRDLFADAVARSGYLEDDRD